MYGQIVKQVIIMEGTRGPFYTIGRLSLPAADTLRRRKSRRRRKQKPES